MTVSIRLALPADARDMAEIHMRSWEAAYAGIIPGEYIREKNRGRPALWERVLAGGNDSRYIIHAEGRAAGFVTCGPSRDDDARDGAWELYGIYLHPDFYRQGIGTQAVDFALGKARERGVREITLWVFAENADSIAFYRACGFSPDGKSQTGEFGKTLVMIRMRRAL